MFGYQWRKIGCGRGLFSSTSVQKQTQRSYVASWLLSTWVDAGAIRGDFLEKMMAHLDRNLFEGNSCRRLPLKDRELEQVFEIAGMMQAHSVLQGGPSLSNLNPAVYAYLMTDSIEQSLLNRATPSGGYTS